MIATKALRQAITLLERALISGRGIADARQGVWKQIELIESAHDVIRANCDDGWAQCNGWRKKYEELLKKPEIGVRP